MSNPLPSRYEIRKLTNEHVDWATAVCIHSNVFCSPVWSKIYPTNQTSIAYEAFKGFKPITQHQIDSGMSYGVFDKEYVFKRPESAKTQGGFYWDMKDDTADSQKLLDQMDNPLMSIALAYDGINAISHEMILAFGASLPRFVTLFGSFEEIDPRLKESWKPTGPGQLLERASTSSRADAEGKGLMKTLAHALMNEAKVRDFKAIQIICAHSAVAHVWLNPPSPYKAKLISQIDMATFEGEDESGEASLVFAPATQVCRQIWVDL